MCSRSYVLNPQDSKTTLLEAASSGYADALVKMLVEYGVAEDLCVFVTS